tara:strand:- start:6596 stop:7036 length:441 start_codon:yes stop_codon:yes gene_type:complete
MNLSKEEINQIVLEELHEILGLKNLLKRKKKDSSEEDKLALSALDQFSPATRTSAKDARVTGYKDLATKEKGITPTLKSRSYSLEEDEGPFTVKKVKTKLGAMFYVMDSEGNKVSGPHKRERDAKEVAADPNTPADYDAAKQILNK